MKPKPPSGSPSQELVQRQVHRIAVGASGGARRGPGRPRKEPEPEPEARREAPKPGPTYSRTDVDLGNDFCLSQMLSTSKAVIQRADDLLREGKVTLTEPGRLKAAQIRENAIKVYHEANDHFRGHTAETPGKVALAVALAGAYEGFIRWCV